MATNLDNTVGEIAANRDRRLLLEGLLRQDQVSSALQFSPGIRLQQMQERYPDRLTQAPIDDAAARLAELYE